MREQQSPACEALTNPTYDNTTNSLNNLINDYCSWSINRYLFSFNGQIVKHAKMWENNGDDLPPDPDLRKSHCEKTKTKRHKRVTNGVKRKTDSSQRVCNMGKFGKLFDHVQDHECCETKKGDPIGEIVG